MDQYQSVLEYTSKYANKEDENLALYNDWSRTYPFTMDGDEACRVVQTINNYRKSDIADSIKKECISK